MKINKIESIAIIGGGTSSWLSAAFLTNNNPNIKITVIDKEFSCSVNVGEATILNFAPFMEMCGFYFEDWFINLDATYKSGILFPNWVRDGVNIWHPFYMNPSINEEFTLHDAWCKNKSYNFIKYGLPMYENSIENCIDRNEIKKYAFHIDCGKLVDFIKNKLKNKINFIQSEVIEVEKKENKLKKVFLKNSQVIESDLFIDCTGWKSLLKEPERNYLNGRLFCDTAVCSRIPYVDRKKEITPYTTAELVDHGWVWKTPVRKRIGSGLVFNRNITPIEEAKKYFISYWNNRINEDEVRILNWTPYYSNNIWEENVVSIGLSAGFIEPLESTGLALIIDGLKKLQNKISDGTWSKIDEEIYNREMQLHFEDCVDFVSMHYSKPYKNTPFWNFVKENYKPSDKIKLIESILSKRLLYSNDRSEYQVFSGANWTTWMIQLGYDVNSDVLIDDLILEKTMVEYYDKFEYFRKSWSVDHETEIKRLELFYNLK